MSQRDDDQHTPDQWHWHMQAISTILDRWRNGELTTWQKRRAIADENTRYYDGDPSAWMTRTGRRYEAPAVIAEAAGVDEEIMVMALNAYRDQGRQAYSDILTAALGGRP